MELLAFGNTGWGDELFYATLMTIAVSITAMLIGFLFALIFTPLKLSKYKIFNSIKKTNRLLIVDEDVPGGASAFILHKILQEQKGESSLCHPVQKSD